MGSSAEFSGRLGPHVLVRENERVVMLVSRTGTARHFSVSEQALTLFRQQYSDNGYVAFTVTFGKDAIELPLAKLPQGSLHPRNSAWRRFTIAELRQSSQLQLL